MAVNIVDAVIARLLATPSVTALTGTRISGKRQDAWALPIAAIVVAGPKGGPGEEPDIPGSLTERLEVTCYGTTGKNVKDLSQAVFDSFIPPSRRGIGFRSANVNVSNVRSEGGRIFLIDDSTKWEYVVIPLLFTYSQTAVAA